MDQRPADAESVAVFDYSALATPPPRLTAVRAAIACHVRPEMAWTLAFALIAVAGLGSKIDSGGHGPDDVALDALNGCLYFAAGRLLWARRAGHPIGRLLMLASIAWFAEDLVTSRSDAVFAFGSAVRDLFVPIVVQLLLAYPSGRLETRAQRIVVAASWAFTLGLDVVLLGVPAAGACACRSRYDVFGVGPWPSAHDALLQTQHVASVALCVVVIVLLARRWRGMSHLERSAVSASAPVVGALCVIFLGASSVRTAFAAHGPIGNALAAAEIVSTLVLPAMILVDVMRRDRVRAEMASMLVDQASPALAEQRLRELLGDPALRVLARGASGWSEAAGGDAQPLARSELLDGGAQVGWLIHDRSLFAEPALLALAVAAATASLRSGSGVAAPAGADAFAGLSEREREVLGLVTLGLSNAAIARRLFVSERTVEKHVARIFTVLQLPNGIESHRRVAAAVLWARAQDQS